MRTGLSGLIESIYRTALEPERWETVMRDAVALSDSRSARVLVLNRNADTVLSSAKFNIDDAYHRDYIEYFVNKCPWRPELRHKPAGRLYSTFLDFSCDQRSFYGSEFYSDWAGPQDISHGMCGTVYQASDLVVQFLIQRTEAAGYYARNEQRLFNEEIVPHMRRAIALGRHLQFERAKSEAVAQTAHRGLPFVLLDVDCRVVFATPMAESLLREGSVLAQRNGRLQASDSTADCKLQRLLKRTARAISGDWREVGGVVRCDARDVQRPAHLMVAPVMAASGRSQFPEAGRFVSVLIHDPENRPRLDLAALMQLFDLTPAEAKVANWLAEGLSVGDIAERHPCTEHTVRAHIKSILAKTGTCRQAELVSLLLATPVLAVTPSAPRLPESSRRVS